MTTTEHDPNGLHAHQPGAKLDAGKPRPSLAVLGFSRALLAVSDVATFGAAKYTDNGWVNVPNGYARYTDAMLAKAKEAKTDVKPPPLDDWFIKVLRSMPDGERGFLKSWGLEDFAKAVAEKVCGALVPTEAPAPTEPPTEATSPAPDDGGWIKWHGGECPVPPDTLVEKKIRAGVKHGPQKAQNLIWRHVDGFNSVYDIVAYRVFKPAPPAKFKLGDTVRKTKGSMWHGTVVGTYSTSLTPEGYAVESATESGSVQIYPASALEAWKPEI